MQLSLRNIPLLVLAVCTLVFAGEQTAVWLDVPFVKQEKNGCGAASIAMVMQYWQRSRAKAQMLLRMRRRFRRSCTRRARAESMHRTWNVTSVNIATRRLPLQGAWKICALTSGKGGH